MAELSRKTSEAGGPSVVAMPDDVEKTTDAKPARPELVDEAEENFQPKTLKFWSVMASIYITLFLVALDRTIIGTAIPRITQDFNSLGDIGWYGSAYQLTTAASQLVFGRVYRFYDIKKVFLFVVAVFEIGSVICGAAPNSIAFILGRAIAGFGAAGIFTGVSIIMLPLVPLRKRPMFQGIFGTIFGISSVMGPLIGGAFTDRVTWRWCFYINLPIGGVAVLCLLAVKLPTRPPEPAKFWEHFTRLDPLGTFFFVPSIVCLLLALQWGGSTYEWNSWRIILLLVLFGVLLLAFMAVQVLMPNTATIPVRIISQRSVAAAATFMFCVAASMMMSVYYLPLWFQTVQGVSAVQSGINTIALVLSLVVASIISGIFTQKVGYYVPSMLVCPMVMAAGQGLMSTFKVDEDSPHWIGYQIIVGFGLGLGMQTAGLSAQAVLPKPDIPTGIALMFFCQQLGGAVFVSVGQNLLSSYIVGHVTDIPGLDPKEITNQGATDLVNKVPPEYKLKVKELYNGAISRIFLCGMGVALVALVAALFMEWKNIKKTGPKGPPGARPSESKENDSTSAGEEQRKSTSQDATANALRHSIQLDGDKRKSSD
ncbi:MFS general substrate transporter [Daldinia loculata]|uniref:MFS general substrate transporter n=1 Tax=Daldinia loculata TaxID=103429 RepID=UPI0020C34130|nr:MFS general substrate transporter [Daldinia loculata]KAI1651883.1 MFS general substrate transporter [Daldinia loculata]KAI2781810.1 MFS general substrate transporter [Daldinia loculata]